MDIVTIVVGIVCIVCWCVYGFVQIRKIAAADDITAKNTQLDMIKSIIDSLVIEENQIHVDKWKALSKDGKLTDEQAKAAFDYVYDEASDIISGSNMLEGVLDLFVNQDGLKTLIEESVNKNKNVFGKLETIQATDISENISVEEKAE